MALCALRPGERAVVCRLLSAGGLRRRLMDIGLIPGGTVQCVGRSPGGDPAAYRIRGAVVALRDADAAQVLVQRTEGRADGENERKSRR